MASIITHQNTHSEDRGLTEILGDLYRNSKNVAQQEIVVIKEETKAVGAKTKVHGALLAGFATLAGLSVFPLLAAAVIGLGNAMNGNYAASALIVGVLCLVIGGGVSYYAWKKMKSDFQFPRSKATFRRLLEFFETESTKLKKDEVFSHGTNN